MHVKMFVSLKFLTTYAKDEITTLAIACNGTYHSVPWAGIHRKV